MWFTEMFVAEKRTPSIKKELICVWEIRDLSLVYEKANNYFYLFTVDRKQKPNVGTLYWEITKTDEPTNF